MNILFYSYVVLQSHVQKMEKNKQEETWEDEQKKG